MFYSLVYTCKYLSQFFGTIFAYIFKVLFQGITLRDKRDDIINSNRRTSLQSPDYLTCNYRECV